MPSSDDRSIVWLELELAAPPGAGPELSVLLERRGFEGWVVEAEEPPRFRVYLPQLSGWERALEALGQELESLGGSLCQSGSLRDEDWAENWKRFYHAFKVGRRLVIRPSWEPYEAQPEERVVVLDPGSAFGTGYHASTRLCLELLQIRAESAPLGRVLDFGTGSGILAIAAHRLGAEGVVACDRDPVALAVARANLEENQARAEVVQADRPPSGPFDVILANLTAEAHLRLGETLAAELGEQGCLILGGIIDERAEEVAQRFESLGLVPEDRRCEDGWVGLSWRSPA